MFVSCQSNQSNISVASEDTTMKYSHQDLGTLSIDLPLSWQRIPSNSLPQAADMTARYWIRTGTGDTMFLVHGFSAWDLSEDDSNNYNRKQDTLFVRKAMMFNSKAGTTNFIGVFVDSVGKVKTVGYYGFTGYVKGLEGASIDSFWNVVRTIRLHPFK
jgi:hypothetical protein